jgi:hypothetical protein
VFAILGVAGKLERRRILERTERGRADAKAKSNSGASRSSLGISGARSKNGLQQERHSAALPAA